jgi:hypothetical protein
MVWRRDSETLAARDAFLVVLQEAAEQPATRPRRRAA